MTQKTDNLSPNNKTMQHLCLLSFIDLIDRIDISIFEIRHLQQTIIYSLHAPVLYQPLRFEEKHVFISHTQNEDHIETVINKENTTEKLVNDWVVSYPSPEEAINHYIEATDKRKADPNDNDDNTNACEKTKIEENLKRRIGQIWLGDDWTPNLRKQYYSLQALQTLKQQIVALKIKLIRAADDTNILMLRSIADDKQQRLSLPAFHILRRGIIHKLDNYIQVLSHHRIQTLQFMDHTSHYSARTTLERRRNIGLYSDYTSNRAQSIQKQTIHLLRTMGIKEIQRPMLFHAWSQVTYTDSMSLHDDINYHNKLHEPDSEKYFSRKDITSYISTSFWTPDRPDIQPIIAREVAISTIKHSLDSLSDNVLSSSEDAFVSLMREIKEVLLKYADATTCDILSEESNKYLLEIASDFLATCIKGVSFIYASFLLNFARGLENQLRVGIDGEIDVDMAYFLGNGCKSFDANMLWYLRLRLSCIWVRRINHGKLTSLDETLLKEVEYSSIHIYQFLKENAPKGRINTQTPWDTIIKEINKKIVLSKSWKIAKEWREERTKDNTRNHLKYDHKRLNNRLRKFLFDTLIEQKEQRSAHNVKLYPKLYDEIKEDTNRLYRHFLDLKTDDFTAENAPENIFYHVSDISYQCSLMKSYDLLKHGNDLKENKEQWKAFLKELPFDIGLGRDLFSIAIEFHISETELPHHYLLLFINLLSHNYSFISDPNFKVKIGQWLNEGAKSATAIIQDFYNHKNQKPEIQLIIEKKLLELHRILNTYTTNDLQEDDKKKLRPVREWLAYIINDNINEDNEKKSKFYGSILTLLKKRYNLDKNSIEKTPIDLNIKLISRLILSNNYPVPNPRNPIINPYTYQKDPNKKALNLIELLKTPHHTSEIPKPSETTQTDRLYITLGNYDAINIRDTTIPCRCSLPYFPQQAILGEPPLVQPIDENNISDEQFITHLSQREIGLELPIDDETIADTSDPTSNESNFFLISSIRLQRRSMRLEFLYRLINSDKNTPSDDPLINLFQKIREKNRITIYLTNGQNDFMLMFCPKAGKNTTIEEINDAFALQQELFHDFMVDSTEMMLSPDCIEVITKANDSDHQFRIHVQAKIHEDRWLENSITMINQLMEKKVEALEKAHIRYQTTFNPEKMDFILSLDSGNIMTDGKTETEEASMHEQILDLFSDNELGISAVSMIERINTTVEMIETNVYERQNTEETSS